LTSRYSDYVAQYQLVRQRLRKGSGRKKMEKGKNGRESKRGGIKGKK